MGQVGTPLLTLGVLMIILCTMLFKDIPIGGQKNGLFGILGKFGSFALGRNASLKGGGGRGGARDGPLPAAAAAAAGVAEGLDVLPGSVGKP